MVNKTLLPNEKTAQEVALALGGSHPDSRTASSRLGSAAISPAAAAAKRKRETRDQLNMEAQELLTHFIHKNVDAIVRVTRTTLDSMRKRVQSAVAHHYVEKGSTIGQGKDSGPDLSPLFSAFVTLQIPNITMQPALDEIQQGLNKAAQYVVSVSKGISQWNKTCKALIKIEKKEKDDSDNEGRSRSASNVGSDDESRSDVGPSRRTQECQRIVTLELSSAWQSFRSERTTSKMSLKIKKLPSSCLSFPQQLILKRRRYDILGILQQV